MPYSDYNKAFDFVPKLQEHATITGRQCIFDALHLAKKPPFLSISSCINYCFFHLYLCFIMKSIRIVSLILALFLFTSLDVEPDPLDLSAYRPVLMLKTDLPNSVFWLPTRAFQQPGKIYLYGQNIFIVDLYKGIHVIDNQNPENPVNTGFIHIPGVLDLAISDDILYADNAIDLVAVDIRNYPTLTITDRVEGVFPEPSPPDLIGNHWYYRRPENSVIVGWVKK